MQNRLLLVLLAWALLAGPLCALAADPAEPAEITYYVVLSSPKAAFNWGDWLIETRDITCKRTGSGGVFVDLVMVVHNQGSHGQNFIPQNMLKLVIAGRFYDAEDIDPKLENMRNIEPLFQARRECYFELPQALLEASTSFCIRFQEPFGSPIDLEVTQTPPSTPTPTPEPSSTPTPTPTPLKAETYTIIGKDVLISSDRQSLARLMSLNGQKGKPDILRQLYKSLVQQEVVFTATRGTSISVENYGADGIDIIRIAGIDLEYYIADQDVKANTSK